VIQNVKETTYHTIKAVHSGLALDIEEYSNKKGAKVHQWESTGAGNQHFYIESNDKEQYRIRAAHSNLYWNIQGGSSETSAHVIQWEWHGADNQLFTFDFL
jgi:hypothetical protein